MGGLFLFTLCVEQILCLCVEVPIGMISIFSRLNLAPDAMHHMERICWRAVYKSVSDRYIVVSSA